MSFPVSQYQNQNSDLNATLAEAKEVVAMLEKLELTGYEIFALPTAFFPNLPILGEDQFADVAEPLNLGLFKEGKFKTNVGALLTSSTLESVAKKSPFAAYRLLLTLIGEKKSPAEAALAIPTVREYVDVALGDILDPLEE